MLDPDELNDADHLLRVMEDAGVEVSAKVVAGSVAIFASDHDGQTYEIRRDDEDIVAAIVELMQRLGWEDIH